MWLTIVTCKHSSTQRKGRVCIVQYTADQPQCPSTQTAEVSCISKKTVFPELDFNIFPYEHNLYI